MSLSLHKIRDLHQRSLLSLLQRASLLNTTFAHPHPLISSIPDSALEECLAYFEDPQQRSHFEEAMEQQPRRLGHVAEYLIWYWLAHIRQCPCHHSVQINSPKRSIGEFDLLFDDNGTKHWWEIAIKFYCFDNAHTGLRAWLGPNAQDHLQRKYEHLFEKQLQLDQHAAAQERLQELNYDSCQSAAFVKGYLFQAIDQPCISSDIDERINSDCIEGYFLRLRDIKQLPQQRKSSRYLRVARHEWLAPVIRPAQSKDIMSHAQIITAVKKNTDFDTHMLIECMPDEAGWWIEQQRTLILPDQWPDLA